MSLVAQMQTFLESLVESFGYTGIAGVMFLESVFPPLPSEMVMPLAGFMVSTGEMNLFGVIGASTLGAVLGTLILYALGRRFSEARIRRLFNEQGRYIGLSESDFERVQVFFSKHGRAIVFWARFLPGVRSPISIPAGLSGMSLRRFLTVTTIGMFLSNTLLTGAGLLVGDHWRQALKLVQQPETLLVSVIIAGVALAAAALWLVYRRTGLPLTVKLEKL